MSERTLEELLEVVARALAAESARIVDATDEPPPDPTTIRCAVPGGRRLVVQLAAAPGDATVLQRRLEMMVETFADQFPRDARPRPSRPPAARTLREELAGLVQRAGASDAIVIDAHSPVVWGSAGVDDGGDPHTPAAAPVNDGGDAPNPIAFDDGGDTQTPAAAVNDGGDAQTPVAVNDGETPAVPVNDGGALPASGALHAVGPEDETAVQFGLASAQGVRVDPGALGVVPRAVCARHRILPIARDGQRLVIAMADPRDAGAVHDVVLITGLDVEPVFAGESMAAFFQHLDDGGDTRTYDEVMAAIPAETRAARGDRARRARDAWARTMRARRAMAEVRALPEMPSLHKGGHLRHMTAEPDFGCVARSFAAIYVLIVIFEGPFEELLAKRAVAQALPTIERLVAALPPLDPQPPTAGVAALRGRRRR